MRGRGEQVNPEGRSMSISVIVLGPGVALAFIALVGLAIRKR
jgi:hypothetical protein